MGKNTAQKIIDAHSKSGDGKPGKNVLPGRSDLPHPWFSPLFREGDTGFFPHLAQHGLGEFVGLPFP